MTLTVSPSTVSFTDVGASYAQDVSVFQSTGVTSYTEANDCSGIATVALSGVDNGTASYVITPSAPGTCSVTFTGKGNRTGMLGVTVTTTGFGVN